MFFCIMVLRIILIISLIAHSVNSDTHTINLKAPERSILVEEITDEKWDQIQKGQWLIGFFDKETPESQQLEGDWQVFALKCQEQGIKTGRVFAPQNPGLYVRFLVTVFPKVFYIKNGVAHEVSKVNRETLVNLIKDQKWSKLKAVNFLSNPFSVQMSLLSHLFVYAVNLYNYEHSIVQTFISSPSATDIVFGFTFIIVGTFLGLLLTCAFGILQIVFMDSKDSEDSPDEKESKKLKQDENEDANEDVNESQGEESSEKSSAVRKRK